VRRLLAISLAVALASAGAAFAGRGDPQERIVPRDQARARAMLVRGSDLSVAFSSRPNPARDSGVYCAALDESDLTVTGVARSPLFTSTVEVVISTAYVYESKTDSDASWRRGTSAAGVACLRAGLRRELGGAGVRLLSFSRLALPRRGQRSVAYRLAVSQQGVRVYLDAVGIQQGRAQAGLIYIAALTPPPRGELLRLSALVARRMESALRGS